MLRRIGVELKTAQELLRRADSPITLEIYQQTKQTMGIDDKRVAHDLAFPGSLLGEDLIQHPLVPSEAI